VAIISKSGSVKFPETSGPVRGLHRDCFIFINLWNYRSCVLTLLTPWCRVLLEKLTGLQLVKKFPAL